MKRRTIGEMKFIVITTGVYRSENGKAGLVRKGKTWSLYRTSQKVSGHPEKASPKLVREGSTLTSLIPWIKKLNKNKLQMKVNEASAYKCDFCKGKNTRTSTQPMCDECWVANGRPSVHKGWKMLVTKIRPERDRSFNPPKYPGSPW